MEYTATVVDMAEIHSWLRGLNPRAKTPTFLLASTFEHTKQPSSCSDYSASNEDNMAKNREPSRVPSMLSFGKSSTSSVTNHSKDITRTHMKKVDHIWYNPNVDQMAETLLAVMMMKESSATIPPEYNSCVLHVLEDYRDMRYELSRREDDLHRVNELQRLQLREFEKLGRDWAQKEKDYKSEMKKLEVLLANGPQGLEAVTLARSNSILLDHDSKETVEQGIERIKSRTSTGRTAERGKNDQLMLCIYRFTVSID
jgi:hypothetical protein